MKRLVCMLLLVLASAWPSRGFGQAPVTDTSTFVLSPGDMLKIQVWRSNELSGDFLVGPDGHVVHPLYRSIEVAGVPLPVVEQRLRTFLNQFESNPAFVIAPEVRIFVGGQVRAQNVYNVPPGTTVSQAIALAGGANEAAKLSRVRVLRQGQTIVVNLDDLTPETLRMQVRSGDEIIVPQRTQVTMYGIFMGLSALASLTSIYLQLRRH